MKIPIRCLYTVGVFFLVSFAARAGMVTNGGFETGDFTGWTQSGDTTFTYIGTHAHTGSYGAHFGPIYGYGYISQTLSTIPGTYYDLSFWEANDRGVPAEVWWDDVLVYNSTSSWGDYWTQITVNSLLATNSSTVLRLGFYNGISYTHVDDIDVVPSGAQIPEPSTFLLAGLGMAVFVASKFFAKKV